MDHPSIHEIIAARAALPSPSRRREIRLAVRASGEAVADAVGVTAATVYGWERGGEPSPRHVVAYVRLLQEMHKAAS